MISIGADQIIDDRYRLARLLGRGGMGSVWVAEDLRLQRDVAIKFLTTFGIEAQSSNLRRRFEREAIAAARLRNPHIVTIHDYGIDADGRPYIVQDLLVGESLDSILNRAPLRASRAVRLALQACSALEAIHTAGLIHRDIKPSNFIVTRTADGAMHLVLLDFGIAKLVGGVHGATETAEDLVVGTPAYMSPEQIRPPFELDARTDLYSLGVTTYEMLAGRGPLAGAGRIHEILHAKLTLDPTPLASVANVSPELNAAVMRCLQRDRNDRFSTAASLREALLQTPEAREAPSLPAPASEAPAPSGAEEDAEPEAACLTRGGVSEQTGAVSEPAPAMRSPYAPSDPLATRLISADALESVATDDEAPPIPSSRADVPLSHEQIRETLLHYLDQAGFRPDDPSSALLRLSRRSGARLPDIALAAIVLDEAAGGGPPVTMETVAFQRGAGALYTLSGTADRPLHVLAVFRGHPGAGVYREWYGLLTTRHVRVLPVSPNELRAHAERGAAEAHLLGLLGRRAENPFQLDGPVEREVDFFGSTRLLGDLVERLHGGGRSFGLFGLRKWGTTSFLRRLRMELADRVTAWTEFAGMIAPTAADVLGAIHEDLARELGRRAPRALAGVPRRAGHAGAREAAATLRDLAAACCEAGLGGPPILFLDDIDALARGPGAAPGELEILVRSLYALTSPEPRAVLVFAGTEDDLFSRQLLGSGDAAFENPFWTRVDRYPTPFFDEAEVGDFFRALGALAGLSLTAEAAVEAHRVTGGQKYLCRMLGTELHRRRTGAAVAKRVDRDDIADCVLPLVAACSDYFERLLQAAPPGTAGMLAELAIEPAWEPDLLRLKKGQRPAHRLRALQFALAHGLVRKEPRGPYRLTIGLLGEWLKWQEPEAGAVEDRPQPESIVIPPPRGAPPAAGHTVVMPAGGLGPGEAAGAPTVEERAEICRIIEASFQPTELEVLAFQLGVELARIASPSLPLGNQALALVRWALQNHQFERLRHLLEEQRPAAFKARASL